MHISTIAIALAAIAYTCTLTSDVVPRLIIAGAFVCMLIIIYSTALARDKCKAQRDALIAHIHKVTGGCIGDT